MVAAGTLATAFVGDRIGKLLEHQQPMKMAAAEALYRTEQPAGLSLFAVAGFDHNPGRNTFDVTIPHGLSIMSGGWNEKVRGIDSIQAEYQRRYGPGDYVPVVGVTYWTFRLMVGSACALLAYAFLGLWLLRGGRFDRSRRFQLLAVLAIPVPYIANTAGWVFTEMGRQPWVVQGLLLTRDAVSPGTSRAEIALSMAGLGVLYAGLGYVLVRLFLRLARQGPGGARPATGADIDDLTLAY
jgi:cytochrome d ubiquinol oxidase subunit I